jgi:hypothetical protein
MIDATQIWERLFLGSLYDAERLGKANRHGIGAVVSLSATLALLPSDMVFFTQITMEAAEDPFFLDTMRKANIKGVLVRVESVTPEGLKDVYKDLNSAGEGLVERLRTFRSHNVHVLGSFIFCTRGFSSLVASTAALIATGWSEPVPGRVYPRCGPAPFTAHPITPFTCPLAVTT